MVNCDADHDVTSSPLAEDARRHLEQARRIVRMALDPRELWLNVEMRNASRMGMKYFFRKSRSPVSPRPRRGAGSRPFRLRHSRARGAFEYTAAPSASRLRISSQRGFRASFQQQAEGQCRDGPMPSIHCQSGNPPRSSNGQVGDDDAQHDVELEEGHETPAPVRRGDLGDIAIGPTTDEAPTANPPTKRKNMNEYQLTITALPTAEIR